MFEEGLFSAVLADEAHALKQSLIDRLPATRNREDAPGDRIADAVRHPRRRARIGNGRGEGGQQAEAAIGGLEQDRAAVRTRVGLIKGGDQDRFARSGSRTGCASVGSFNAGTSRGMKLVWYLMAPGPVRRFLATRRSSLPCSTARRRWNPCARTCALFIVILSRLVNRQGYQTIGRTLSCRHVLDRLGEGRMGVVYTVRDKHPEGDSHA
jgi:hypothetical protein